MATPAVQPEAQFPLSEATFDSGQDTSCDGQNDDREVSLEQYLHTIYSPDCDYIDGHLEERNLGELDHGDIQTEIAVIFRFNAAAWQVKAVVELRLQVKAGRFRVPDVMVLHPGQKKTQIIREAPLLCVEVLSPQDRWRRLKEKVDDYLAMGVENVWAFDPASREAFRCDADGFHKVSAAELSIPGTAIRLQVAEIFSVLDSE